MRVIEIRRGLSLIFSNKARSSPVLLVFTSYPHLDLKKQTVASSPPLSQRPALQDNVVLPLQWWHIKMQRLVASPNCAILLFFFTVIFLSFLLEHVLSMTEILSSPFERKAGVLD